MVNTWCVGGTYCSNIKNLNKYENINPKTKKLVNVIKGSCSNCGRNKSQILTK